MGAVLALLVPAPQFPFAPLILATLKVLIPCTQFPAHESPPGSLFPLGQPMTHLLFFSFSLKKQLPQRLHLILHIDIYGELFAEHLVHFFHSNIHVFNYTFILLDR